MHAWLLTMVVLWRRGIFTYVHLRVGCSVCKVGIQHDILSRIARVIVWYFPDSIASFLKINVSDYVILKGFLRSGCNLFCRLYDSWGSLSKGSFSFNLNNYEVHSYYDTYSSNTRRNSNIDSKHFFFHAIAGIIRTFNQSFYTRLICKLRTCHYLCFFLREISTKILINDWEEIDNIWISVSLIRYISSIRVLIR